ncbi:MAG: TIR domain-containing protein [bacterium]
MEEGFQYDVFISHASEDSEWCDALAERLRNDNVRVWYDRWELQPGDHLLEKLNEGIEQSRKMICVWSPNYFSDKSTWTLVEVFSQRHKDVLAEQRPIIPLVITECKIPPTLRNILYIDCKNPDDFEIRYRQLIEALDIVKDDTLLKIRIDFHERKLNVSKRGEEAYKKGKSFEEEVSKLYQLLGFAVKPDVKVDGIQIDLTIEKKDGGLLTQAIIECKDKQITANERDQILAQQNIVQKKLPAYRWIAVSSSGFAADTRTALDSAGVSCITYSELLRELIPLENYVESIISAYETKIIENWNGEDWFIRPNIMNDITYEVMPGMERISKWFGDSNINFLTVLGDLGTGKSTLSEFLAYNLARSFKDDPLRHPAPVIIPLKDVRKENTLESIIISHFSKHGLPGINFPRFEHLVRIGKVVLFFDAFDEMADRVRWEVTMSNFNELRRAAVEKGKVILTCRTHYFKDREEQVKLIGEGPSLSETETELYKQLRQQSGAEVIYLKEFSDEQIKEYLIKARPKTHLEDWKKIEEIHNLKELAQRPLLLDMIVKSLPKLDKGQQVNAANLYNVYTNIWIERDEARRDFVLDKNTKRRLMLELAWRMWDEGTTQISHKELKLFVENLAKERVVDFGDEELEDVIRVIRAATFLKRDDPKNFAFCHRSFMEFFLARKIFECYSGENGNNNPASVLNTKRFDQKIVFFLSLLDEKEIIIPHLQQILKTGYQKNISENALQILYWFGRIKYGMEKEIKDVEKLKNITAHYIPQNAQLQNANLQEIILEGADLTGANFVETDLSAAKLINAILNDASLKKAKLNYASLDYATAEVTDFSSIEAEGVSFIGSTLDISFFSLPIIDEKIHTITDDKVPRIIRRKKLINREKLESVVQLGNSAGVYAVAFHKDGNFTAAAGGDGILRIYDINDGKLIRTLEGHQSSVNSVAFSPNGDFIISGSDDKSVKLWDAKSGKLIRTLEGHQSSVNSVAFSPNGDFIISGSSDKSVKLWDAKSGKLIRTLEGHQSSVNSVAFSPNGDFIISGSSDKSVKLWDAKSGKLIRTLEGHQYSVNSVAFSPNGEFIISGSYDNTVKLWDAKSGKLIRILRGHQDMVNSAEFSPDGEFFISGSNDMSITLWDSKSGKFIRRLEGHKSSVYSVVFSPNGKFIISGSDDKSIKLWDSKSCKLIRTLEGHKQSVNSVAFSPNGDFIISGSSDKSVRLWEVKSGKLIRTIEGYQSNIYSVAFSPNGDFIISGSDDNSIKLWDLKSVKFIRKLEGHKYSVDYVAFSPNGEFIISGSSDHSVRLWDSKSGKCIATVINNLGWISSVNFAPNVKYFISAGAAGRLQFWSMEDYQTFLYLYSFGPGAWLKLLPDGRFDASPEGMRYLRYTQKGTFNSFSAEELVKEFYDSAGVEEVIKKYAS